MCNTLRRKPQHFFVAQNVVKEFLWTVLHRKTRPMIMGTLFPRVTVGIAAGCLMDTPTGRHGDGPLPPWCELVGEFVAITAAVPSCGPTTASANAPAAPTAQGLAAR